LHKAQKEVDEVVGDGVLEFQHLAKLTYIDACLKETLRLSSPIISIFLHPKEDTLLDGKYTVSKDTYIQVNLKGLHHDRSVWGDDHDDFRPERMLDGGFQALPPNSWKPFGNGMRACIGRTFAEQEMIMNVALVLQRFQIELADPTYKLELKSTLTIKPWQFKMKVRRRPGKTLMTGIPGGIPSDVARKQKDPPETHHVKSTDTHQAPVTILFGGNTGTCESLAQDLEVKASENGLQATLRSLDSATENLPTDQPVVIITASYEGKPPDNAKKFVTWLEHLDKPDHLKGVKYTVFGVGNSDWASTFHRVPKLVDETMAKLGATSFFDAGYTNVKTDLVGPWEDYLEGLFGALRRAAGATGTVESNAISVSVQSMKEVSIPRLEEPSFGTVLVNRELAGTEVGPAKRHMEVRLPEGSTYTAGDYLVVLPRNPEETVRRILSHFKLSDNDTISVQGSKKKFLPTEPVSAREFFSTAVELSTPITKRQIEILVANSKPEQKREIEKLKEDSAYQTLLQKRYSIIDVLDEYLVEIPLSSYIDMLQPLAARQYSISSSALHPANNPAQKEHADISSITFDVFEAPALSGHGMFHGVASSFLASRRPGDRISCSVRSTNVGFRLPSNPETPVTMIAAGTGIAPMRAFIQERAAIAEAGIRKLGPAVLFFGCRHEEKDYIYKDELREWEKKGIVEVKTAFSKMNDKPVYVQDVIWDNREQVRNMFRSGGKIFLCGSASKLGNSSSEVCKKIYKESGHTDQEADEWLERQKEDRYVSDVYG
jgi:cytochrome P450/NADPH-cytochrome P450 reductase